ncbi:MAG: 3-hydroxyacyl-ACP dehydratase FabZ family protein [Bdellovibrionota bacterium]
MPNNPLTPAQLLELIPQRFPFRFVDEIVAVNEQEITGRYRFREDESFYAGHFPGNPVTPGVILLESMCQVGVVALGIYLLAQEASLEEVKLWTTMFADAQVEFVKAVLPGETVTIRGEKIFWRRKKLRCRIEMFAADGTLVAQATASGIGVKHG